jgi:rhomboid protease GluP
MDNNFTVAEPITPEVRQPSRPSPYTVTYALIAINVLVYLAMVATGVSFMNPTPLDVFRWGGDFGPATVGAHQWWRLLTSMFLHFGIIHIGFNMYVLYQIGPFIETIFGRLRYLLIYFIAGLAGSFVSVSFHPDSVGAGASGAIFGLYGAVFGFLLLERKSLLPGAANSIAKSAGIFVLYNVVYGAMQRNTDLTAHFGGLIGGFLAGLALVRSRPGRQ